MPIYAYRCDTCGQAKDVLQKVSDPLLTVCPFCGADTFRKQVTAAGFQLKGSGWYATDFKGGGTAVAPPKTPAGESESKPPSGDSAPAGETKKADAPSGSSAPAAPVAKPSGSGASSQ